MGEYWKSNAKKYCEFCKVWIADNKASISIHENGNKHQTAIKAKLFSIKNQQEDKKKQDLIYEATMKQIEQAAARAMHRDLTSNPTALNQYGTMPKLTTNISNSSTDTSTTYYDQVKPSANKESQQKIQKRKIEDKPQLESKIGEWKSIQSNQTKKLVDLQLPSGNKMAQKLHETSEITRVEQEMSVLHKQIEKQKKSNQVDDENEQEIKEKIVKLKTTSSSSAGAPISFKKRKTDGHSMRSRTND